MQQRKIAKRVKSLVNILSDMKATLTQLLSSKDAASKVLGETLRAWILELEMYAEQQEEEKQARVVSNLQGIRESLAETSTLLEESKEEESKDPPEEKGGKKRK